MLTISELASFPCMGYFKILQNFNLFDSTERNLTLKPFSLKILLRSLIFSSFTPLFVFNCTVVHVVADDVLDKVYHRVNVDCRNLEKVYTGIHKLNYNLVSFRKTIF